MRAQKNHMGPRIIELFFLKSEVDFELLWRCISKIRRTTHMATYTKEIENLNNKIVYKNSTVQLPMFILVSMTLGFITGGLLGSPWERFWYWSGLTKSLFVLCEGVRPEKNQKFKKVESLGTAFFYKELTSVGRFGIGGLKTFEQASQSWLAGLILCLVPVLYAFVRTFTAIFLISVDALDLFHQARRHLGAPLLSHRKIYCQ